MSDLPFAENVNYWKTGKSSPDIWIDRAKAQIVKLGGIILVEGFGKEGVNGRAAYMLSFEIVDDCFKVIWPVLPSKSENERAARIQAATLLYHDVKAKCISAAVLGSRTAFLSYLILPNGRTAAEITVSELARMLPGFMLSRPQLEVNNVDTIIDV